MSENIHQAINTIMNEVGYVKKSRSAGVNYSFAGEAALISALRPSMVENGVYMHVLEIKNITRENTTTKNGTQMTNTLISATIRFTHAPSGTSIDVAATGEGFDSGDKSANKAMTGLYKYAMRQTFCIETGDDPDKFASPEQKEEAKKIEPPTAKVTNEIITDSEWETFCALRDKVAALNVKLPEYNREKMKPADLNNVTKFFNSKLGGNK